MQQNRGFTLLELLVVLVLIGIILTLAVLSMGSTGLNRQLEQEGRRFISLVEMTGDEAILTGKELGIDFSRREYRILALVDGSWLPYRPDKIFRKRSLPESAFFQLSIDGLQVGLPEQLAQLEPLELLEQSEGDGGEDSVTKESGVKPQLFILSSGERNAFALQLVTTTENHYQIDGDMAGVLLMSRMGAVE